MVDRWLIDSMEEMSLLQPVTAADAMRALDWLVGDWQDVEAKSPVRSTVKRSLGGAFLVRSFQATNEDGALVRSTQIIGWDPRLQQYRSWIFDADGSFGDGLWSKSGNDWLIKSTQTLADGRVASGTYVMTPQSEDALTVQLIGSEIEGQLQPSSPIVVVRRETETDQATEIDTSQQ